MLYIPIAHFSLEIHILTHNRVVVIFVLIFVLAGRARLRAIFAVGVIARARVARAGKDWAAPWGRCHRGARTSGSQRTSPSVSLCT